eukprot:gene6327-6813_t
MNGLKKEENNLTVISSVSQFPLIDESYLSDPEANQVVRKALALFDKILGKGTAFTEEDKERLRKTTLKFFSVELPKLEGSLVQDSSHRLENDEVLERMFKYFEEFSQLDPAKANYRANFYGIILYLISYKYMENQDMNDSNWTLQFNKVLSDAKVELKPSDTKEYTKLLRFVGVIEYLMSLFTPYQQMFYFAASLLQGPEITYHAQTGRPGKPKANRDKIYAFVTGKSPQTRKRKKKPKEHIDTSSTEGKEDQFRSTLLGSQQLSTDGVRILTTVPSLDCALPVEVTSNEATLNPSFQADSQLFFMDNDVEAFNLNELWDFENCTDLDQRVDQIWDQPYFTSSSCGKCGTPSEATPMKKQKKHHFND